MRRTPLKLLVLLLLGAVVNVGVAWGCALVAPIRPFTSPVERVSAAEEWIGYLFMEPGGVQIRSLPDDELTRLRYQDHQYSLRSAFVVFAMGRERANAPDPSTAVSTSRLPQGMRSAVNVATKDGHCLVLEARGWPAQCVQWSARVGFDPRRHDLAADPECISHGIVLPAAWWNDAQQRVLPFAPIYRGFAINAPLYAAVLWLFFAAPFTVRRIIRRRRGCCVRCGYDLQHAEHGTCPECGNAGTGESG